VDANTYLERKGNSIMFTRDPQKFRGPEFKPIPFVLENVTSRDLSDADGTPVVTVNASPLTWQDYASRTAKIDAETEALHAKWAANPGRTLSQYAELFGFDEPMGKGKNKAARLIKQWEAEEPTAKVT
jgi:hypothetical protein